MGGARLRQRAAAIGFVVALLLYPGCSSIMDVRTVGSTATGVVFGFYEHGAELATRMKITNLDVQEFTSGNQWKTVWWVRGAHVLSAATYGEAYSGLHVQVAALPLKPNTTYRVSVSALPGSVIAYGNDTFETDDEGRVFHRRQATSDRAFSSAGGAAPRRISPGGGVGSRNGVV